MLAYAFEGRRYDCGSKLGYLEATVDFGLKHPELAEDFAAFLREHGERLPSMTLTELRYIVAVANERSFGRAAQKCFVSQPALSVAIQKLEEELGARLFERGKNEVTVTPVGARIVEQAQKVLEEAARIREIAQAGRNPLSGTLKLGVIFTVAPYLLPDLIPALHELAPQMPLEIEENLTERTRERAEVGAHRRRDRRAAVHAARHRHRIPVRGAVPGRGAAGHRWARRKSIAAGRALRRARDPAQRRPLLSRPGAGRLSRAQPRGRADDADELARDRAQHGGVGARRLGAAARRADAEVPQRWWCRCRSRSRRRHGASRSRIGRASRGRRRCGDSRCGRRVPRAGQCRRRSTGGACGASRAAREGPSDERGARKLRRERVANAWHDGQNSRARFVRSSRMICAQSKHFEKRKGLTTKANPLIRLVGGTGIEPVAPAV